MNQLTIRLISIISKKRDSINLLNLLNTNTSESISILCNICYKKQYIDLIRELRNHHLFNYNHLNKYLENDVKYYSTDIIYFLLFIIEEINTYGFTNSSNSILALELAKKYGYDSEYNYIVQKNYNFLVNDFKLL